METESTITKLEIPKFRKIAVALDFSRQDEKLLAFAIGQGGTESRYILIHVVESASARMLGKQSDDLETRTDQERLNSYQHHLKKTIIKRLHDWDILIAARKLYAL